MEVTIRTGTSVPAEALEPVWNSEPLRGPRVKVISASDERPVRFPGTFRGRAVWLFRREVFTAEPSLSKEETVALILHREAGKSRTIKRALASIRVERDDSGKRGPIPDDVKIFVWQRDKGRCVKCGGASNLEFDHIIPLAMGGSNTARNIQLLCERCNRSKGGNLV